MAVLLDAIHHQINHSIYENPSNEAKYQLVSSCEWVKRITGIIFIAAPIFAFCLPYVFGVVTCIGLGLFCFDIFNMADNVGDAAKLSAEGGAPSTSRTNVEMLVESTLLAKSLYNRIQRPLLEQQNVDYADQQDNELDI
jgi:hypothetical protein